jgi:hypothetical protein
MSVSKTFKNLREIVLSVRVSALFHGVGKKILYNSDIYKELLEVSLRTDICKEFLKVSLRTDICKGLLEICLRTTCPRLSDLMKDADTKSSWEYTIFR